MKLLARLMPRDRRAIILGAGALAALVVVRYLLVPWWQGWGQARQEAAEYQAQVDALETKLIRLANMQDSAVKLYGPSAARPLEPAETARIAFTKAAQDILRGAGVQFESITPQPMRALRELPDVTFMPFQVKGRCALPQLAKCLADMRQAPVPILVDRMHVSSIDKSPGQLELTMVLATLGRQERTGP